MAKLSSKSIGSPGPGDFFVFLESHDDGTFTIRRVSFDELQALTAGQATVEARDPTATDDAAAGYAVGSIWVNTSSGSEAAFIASDVTEDAAVWEPWPGGGGGGDGGGSQPQPFIVACSDETSDLEAGAAKATFRMPYAATLLSVKADVNTAPTGSGLQVDINKNGSSVLSTPITIDPGQDTSATSAVPPVISNAVLANNDKITIDLDSVGDTTPGNGLKVTLTVMPA